MRAYQGRSLLTIIAALALTLLAPLQNSTATSAQPQYKAPILNCKGSGALTGTHPGWSSEAAKNITIAPLSASTYAAYWCPAVATTFHGQISYTLTSSLGGGTCETTATHCQLPLYSKTAIYYLMATDQTGNYQNPVIAVQNPGTPIPCTPARGSCNNKYQGMTFQGYGNLTGTNDCTLAAEANWESLNLGVTPANIELLTDWQLASPNNLGINNTQALAFWTNNGISGIKLQKAETVNIDPISLMNALDNNKSLIGSLAFNAGQNFAGVNFPSYTQHWVLVDGYTPQGPLVVSWGRTLQMTWQQWNLEAVMAYKITAALPTKLK